MDSSDEQWPPSEFGRSDASSGPNGLFVDSDDEDNGRPASTAAGAAAVDDAESGLLAGAASSNGNGYGSVPGGEEEVDGGAVVGQAEPLKGREEEPLNGGGGGGGKEEPAAPAEGLRAWCRMPSLPDMLIYGGFLLNMSTKGTIACFETLGAEYAMTHFGMSSAEAGSTFATFGTIGVVRFVFVFFVGRSVCRSVCRCF